MDKTLLEKPVKSSLLAMAAPAAFGMLMTFMFQLVDAYFIGKLGSKELAAISFSYPVYIFIVSFFMGTAAGVSSTVGKALGEGNTEKSKALTSLSVLFFMLLTLILGVIGYFSIEPVFRSLGASSEMVHLVSDYMQPLYLGMLALVGGLIGNAALMAKGMMIKSTIIMGIGGLVNLVLDYVLIFGAGPFPALGLQGAAIATVISWLVIFILMMALLLKEQLLSFRAVQSVKDAMIKLQEIGRISTPAIAAQVLNPIAIAVITKVVSQYGDNAVAAYGIVARIESLLLTGILALSVILTPFVAQNFGAKEKKRLDQTIAYSGRMTVYWGFTFFIFIAVFSTPIVSLFTRHTEIIEYSQYYFYFVGFSFPAFGLALITTSFFNGVQQPVLSLKITLVKSLLLTIPFAFIGALFSVEAIWISLALANIIGALYAKNVLDKWLANNDSSLIGHKALKDYVSDFKR